MKITSLTLHNFRSYKQKTLKFSQGTTVFVGPNAIGKTNILEAITLLAIGKSFRISSDEEMISWGQELGRVSAVIDDESLEIVLTHGSVQGKRVTKKRYLVNGVGKRRQDFLGQLKVVLFEPQDLQLVVGSPSRRRDYLDFVLAQIDWQYNRSLTIYRKVLRQRNRLLMQIREGEAQETQLEYWNRSLIKNGELLQNMRADYLDYLTDFKTSTPLSLSSTFIYDRSVISEKRLKEYRQAEIASGNTLVGPHRDDFVIKFKVPSNPAGRQSPKYKAKDGVILSEVPILHRDEAKNLVESTTTNGILRRYSPQDDKGKVRMTRELFIYGSRGQQRLVVLFMKLAELEYISEKTKERPVLLLDDIFSELDDIHDKIVTKIIDKQQTIVTTTEISNFSNAEVVKLE